MTVQYTHQVCEVYVEYLMSGFKHKVSQGTHYINVKVNVLYSCLHSYINHCFPSSDLESPCAQPTSTYCPFLERLRVGLVRFQANSLTLLVTLSSPFKHAKPFAAVNTNSPRGTPCAIL